jgi:hypothetical protein
MGTRDWYLMHYSNSSVTGGQKHTHTHTYVEDWKEANKPRLWNSLPAVVTESYIQDTWAKLETPLACPPGGPKE